MCIICHGFSTIFPERSACFKVHSAFWFPYSELLWLHEHNSISWLIVHLSISVIHLSISWTWAWLNLIHVQLIMNRFDHSHHLSNLVLLSSAFISPHVQMIPNGGDSPAIYQPFHYTPNFHKSKLDLTPCFWPKS